MFSFGFWGPGGIPLDSQRHFEPPQGLNTPGAFFWTHFSNFLKFFGFLDQAAWDMGQAAWDMGQAAWDIGQAAWDMGQAHGTWARPHGPWAGPMGMGRAHGTWARPHGTWAGPMGHGPGPWDMGRARAAGGEPLIRRRLKFRAFPPLPLSPTHS